MNTSLQLGMPSWPVAAGPARRLHALVSGWRKWLLLCASLLILAPAWADPPISSPLDHPRIHLGGGRLDALRARAGYDANGNRLNGVVPSSAWTQFSNHMSNYRTSGYDYGMWGWHFALMYMITQDQAYFDRAMTFLTENMTGVSSGQFGRGTYNPGAEETILDRRMIDLGHLSPRYDQHLYAGLYVRDAALIYDWFYPKLTPAQRQQIVDYINSIEGEVWDPENRAGLPGRKTWPGWGLTDVSNNFHWSHLMGLGYATLALSGPGENPNQPVVYMQDKPEPTLYQPYGTYGELLAAKLALDTPFLATFGKGGAWLEGHSYGDYAMSEMMELFYALYTSQAANLFADSPFPKEAALYQLYAAQPAQDGEGMLYINDVQMTGRGIFFNLAGDNPNGVFIRDTERLFLLQIADALGADPDAGRIRAWLQAKFPNTVYRPFLANTFLVDLASTSVADPTSLPPDYYSPGMGWVNSRSTNLTDPNAVSLTFQSADRAQWHQHEDANAFVLYYKQWQVTDAGPYLTNIDFVPRLKSEYHSTVLPDGAEQRMSRNTSGIPGYPDTVNPTGKITRQESGRDYSYMVGDASDAYYVMPRGHYDTGTTRLLNTFIREMLHLRPNLVLVYDRVSPVVTSTPISYQIITPKQPVSLNATDVSATNGGGMVFQRTLLPLQATVSPQLIPDEGSLPSPGVWRTVVKAPSQSANVTFFHLLETADAGSGNMLSSTNVVAAGGVMNGVLIGTQPANTAVFFANNTDGRDLQGGASYSLTPATISVRHLVFNLVPGASYNITATGGANPTISFSPGGSFTASAAGCLDFTTDNQGNVTQSDANPGGGTTSVAVSPSSLDFGSQPQGSTGTAQSVALSNNGSNTLNIASVQASGDFSATSDCGTSLAPAASCTIAVSFRPTASGSRTGTLTISSDDPASPHTVSLSGTGQSVAASATLTPSSLSFAATPQGSSSASQTVTLRNSGNATLNIAAVQVSGDYSVTNGCGNTLAAATSCTIEVSFTPTATGSRTGTLSISHDAGGSPQTVALSGTGQATSSTQLNLVAGWNLVGNPYSSTVDVASVFGDASKVSTVWKWLAGSGKWAFFTPSQPDGGAAYAASKGYMGLASIRAGEGFWVNAKTAFQVSIGSGSPLATNWFQDGSDHALPSGWSLIAVGDNPTPANFMNSIGFVPPTPGTTNAGSASTLWAWYPGDGSHSAGWYFYAPSLDNGGTLANYISGKGYLDFSIRGKTLDRATGFWVNHL